MRENQACDKTASAEKIQVEDFMNYTRNLIDN